MDYPDPSKNEKLNTALSTSVSQEKPRELSAVLQNWNELKQHEKDLTKKHDGLEKEIQKTNEKLLDTELEISLNNLRLATFDGFVDALNKVHEEEVRELNKNYEQKVKASKELHEEVISRLKSNNNGGLIQLQTNKHNTELQELEETRKLEMKQLNDDVKMTVERKGNRDEVELSMVTKRVLLDKQKEDLNKQLGEMKATQGKYTDYLDRIDKKKKVLLTERASERAKPDDGYSIVVESIKGEIDHPLYGERFSSKDELITIAYKSGMDRYMDEGSKYSLASLEDFYIEIKRTQTQDITYSQQPLSSSSSLLDRPGSSSYSSSHPSYQPNNSSSLLSRIIKWLDKKDAGVLSEKLEEIRDELSYLKQRFKPPVEQERKSSLSSLSEDSIPEKKAIDEQWPIKKWTFASLLERPRLNDIAQFLGFKKPLDLPPPTYRQATTLNSSPVEKAKRAINGAAHFMGFKKPFDLPPSYHHASTPNSTQEVGHLSVPENPVPTRQQITSIKRSSISKPMTFDDLLKRSSKEGAKPTILEITGTQNANGKSHVEFKAHSFPPGEGAKVYAAFDHPAVQAWVNPQNKEAKSIKAEPITVGQRISLDKGKIVEQDLTVNYAKTKTQGINGPDVNGSGVIKSRK